MTNDTNYNPGGDAKVIAQIAKDEFGGFQEMFKKHD